MVQIKGSGHTLKQGVAQAHNAFSRPGSYVQKKNSTVQWFYTEERQRRGARWPIATVPLGYGNKTTGRMFAVLMVLAVLNKTSFNQPALVRSSIANLSTAASQLKHAWPVVLLYYLLVSMPLEQFVLHRVTLFLLFFYKPWECVLKFLFLNRQIRYKSIIIRSSLNLFQRMIGELSGITLLLPL